MASIFKRRGKYSVVYRYTDENGVERQKWETFTTEKEAKARKRQVEQKMDEHTFVVPTAKTLHDLLEEYLARRENKLREVKKEVETFGHKCVYVVCDVTSPDEIEHSIETIMAEFGRVDILVNNTGGGPGGPIEEMSDEVFMHHINLDILATFRFTRGFGKYMLENQYGRVINIASILGLGGIGTVEGEAKCIGYEAAKGAVINFTRGAAVEWAKRGVTVNAICPGFFYSEAVNEERAKFLMNMIRKKTPMGRLGKSCTDINEGSELDSSIIFLAADESSFVTGTVISCDGGWSAY